MPVASAPSSFPILGLLEYVMSMQRRHIKSTFDDHLTGLNDLIEELSLTYLGFPLC
jgi:hypothetical protein